MIVCLSTTLIDGPPAIANTATPRPTISRPSLSGLGLARARCTLTQSSTSSVNSLQLIPAAWPRPARPADRPLVSMVCRLIEQKTDVCATGHTSVARSGSFNKSIWVLCRSDTASSSNGPPGSVHDPLPRAAGEPIIRGGGLPRYPGLRMGRNLLYLPGKTEPEKAAPILRSVAVGKAAFCRRIGGVATISVIEARRQPSAPNDLAADFETAASSHRSPVVTVVAHHCRTGMPLPVERGWKAVGLEMEGGHLPSAPHRPPLSRATFAPNRNGYRAIRRCCSCTGFITVLLWRTDPVVQQPWAGKPRGLQPAHLCQDCFDVRAGCRSRCTAQPGAVGCG